VCLAPPRRILAIHVPLTAHRYLSHYETPGELPTLAASGSCSPLHTHTDPPEEKEGGGGRRRSGAVCGGAVRREDRSRPWEEPDPQSPRTPTSPTSPTSSTLHHRLRLPPCRRVAPPHFTNACTTARGHQGEEGHFPALVDAPAFELRGDKPSLRAASGDAGLRARLGQNHLQVSLPSSTRMLKVKIRSPSHEFTFGVGISFIPYPLVLTPVV
jgi:hypothetical protein